jgi:uncharacterized SAM-binding protein YcdF (DUF218 family)
MYIITHHSDEKMKLHSALKLPRLKKLVVRFKKNLVLTTTIALIVVSSIIPIRSTIALHQAPTPQVILVLEGNTDRVRFAAQFSKSHPTLPIWISGNPGGWNLNQVIFQQAGISTQQLHYDFCATDTVTNFTCNVKAFATRGIQHVYLITSDYHMDRSKAIATVVFGSQGIAITPISVQSEGRSPESGLRTLRDIVRSLTWLVTGRTGASLNPELHR